MVSGSFDKYYDGYYNWASQEDKSRPMHEDMEGKLSSLLGGKWHFATNIDKNLTSDTLLDFIDAKNNDYVFIPVAYTYSGDLVPGLVAVYTREKEHECPNCGYKTITATRDDCSNKIRLCENCKRWEDI